MRVERYIIFNEERNKKMQNKSGFTLAEVLITLGIIGVVAAMTIPTLMTNTTASQFKTAYKKSLSNLKQAITLNVAMDDFDLRDLKDSKTAANKKSAKSFSQIIPKRFEGAEDITATYFDAKNANDGTGVMTVKGDHVCTQADVDAEGDARIYDCEDVDEVITGAAIEYKINKTNFIVFQMADGTAFGFNINAANCTSKAQENCVGFIDTNGIAGPNRVNVCDTATYDTKTTCIVSNDKVADIFPVVFYNQAVEPGSVAAKSILMGFKANK